MPWITVPPHLETKLIVAGSRSITDKELVYQLIDAECSWLRVIEIVSGGAPGVDRLAEQYAIDKGVSLTLCPAGWDKYGKAAGPIRNQEMGEYGDRLLCIWDGESRGSANMISVMQKLGKPYNVVTIKGETK